MPMVYRDVLGDALFHPQDGYDIYYYFILIQKDFCKNRNEVPSFHDTSYFHFRVEIM
jgi:hypothetical protein